jgi:hypothetical protein
MPIARGEGNKEVLKQLQELSFYIEELLKYHVIGMGEGGLLLH